MKTLWGNGYYTLEIRNPGPGRPVSEEGAYRMDSLELNKIVAGVLGAFLLLLLFGWVSDSVYGFYGGHDEEHLAFEIELPEEEGAEVEVADAGPSIGELLQTASADEAAFRACAACHNAAEEANGVGPHLVGLLGRDIGSVAGYDYSDTLAGMGDVWTAEAISAFIENPRGWAPGTKMAYNGMRRAEDRADVIAYIAAAGGQDISEFIVLPEEDASAEGEAVEEASTEEAVTEEETAEAPVDERVEPTDATTGDGEGDVADTGSEADETTPEEEAVAEDEAVAPAAEDETQAAEDVAPAAEDGAVAADTTGDADASVTGDDVTATTDEVTTAPSRAPEADDASNVDEAASETIEEENAPAADEATEAAPAEEAAPADDAAADVPAFMQNASAEAGEGLFRACRACHVLEDGVNRAGPHLYGIVGREVAAVEGFNYSSAMQEKGGTWTYEELSGYLENPREWVPGTRMGYAGMRSEEDRANLIAYLEAAGSE